LTTSYVTSIDEKDERDEDEKLSENGIEIRHSERAHVVSHYHVEAV
jgi:hypothetical protein